jgi:serine/threonine protein kinase
MSVQCLIYTLLQNNVLADDNGGARLADFGRTKVIGVHGYTAHLFAGSAQFMAPELFPDEAEDDEDVELPEPPFSPKSDLYAFAVVAFQVWDPLFVR